MGALCGEKPGRSGPDHTKTKRPQNLASVHTPSRTMALVNGETSCFLTLLIYFFLRRILWPNFHRRFLILLSWIPALQVSLTTRVSATGAAVFCLPCLLVGSLIPPQPPLHPITSNHTSPTSQTKIYAFKWQVLRVCNGFCLKSVSLYLDICWLKSINKSQSCD